MVDLDELERFVADLRASERGASHTAVSIDGLAWLISQARAAEVLRAEVAMAAKVVCKVHHERDTAWRELHTAEGLRAEVEKVNAIAAQYQNLHLAAESQLALCREALVEKFTDDAGYEWRRCLICAPAAVQEIAGEIEHAPTCILSSREGPPTVTATELPEGLVMKGDPVAALNVRGFVESALLATKRVTITGKGYGPNVSDLDFTIDGAPFNVEVRPRLNVPEGK